MSAPVIVFGPTGNVGSVAARTANSHGAKVFLAMRDPNKSIPGLSADEERSGGYERVQADLSQPETIKAAVEKSGAKRAFIYLLWGAEKGMRKVLEALKEGGVEFVVFLSSFTVEGDRTKIPPEEMIPYNHAQVELSLEEVFPDKFVAVRPGYFATNVLPRRTAIRKGEVELFCPNGKYDHIAPGDMGRVSGTILAKGPQDGQQFVYLYGPKMVSQEEAVKTVAKVLGCEVNVKDVSEQYAFDHTMPGVPAGVKNHLLDRAKKTNASADPAGDLPEYDQGRDNIRKYTGREPTGFEEFVQEYKEQFAN